MRGKRRKITTEEYLIISSTTPIVAVQLLLFTSIRSYDLPIPDLVRMDNHCFDRHFASHIANTYSAIITDPPYGIRAGAKKSGRNGVAQAIPDDKRNDLIPCTQNYAVEDVMLDLLHVAATALKLYDISAAPLIFM